MKITSAFSKGEKNTAAHTQHVFLLKKLGLVLSSMQFNVSLQALIVQCHQAIPVQRGCGHV